MIRTRLSNVDALRGLAASAVVLYHVARHLDRASPLPGLIAATKFGHAGVDLFFVLSGFIILFVHRGDTGRPARWRNYAARRFSRVAPTYWVALAATVALAVAGGHIPPFDRLVSSAILLPSSQEPLVGVAWTLQYEIVFYVLFCALIFSRSAGLAVLGAWLAAILASWAGLWRPPAALPFSLFGPCNIEFFLGMAAAWLLILRRAPWPRLLLIAGVASFAAAGLSEDAGLFDGYAASARLIYGGASALLLAGIVECDRSNLLRMPSWLVALGEASYSIYLFQFVFIGILWKAASLAAVPAPAWLMFPLLSAAAIGGGFLLFRTIERPLLRATRSGRPAQADVLPDTSGKANQPA